MNKTETVLELMNDHIYYKIAISLYRVTSSQQINNYSSDKKRLKHNTFGKLFVNQVYNA